MADAHVKMQRIKRANRNKLDVLGSALNPEILHARVPRLAEAAEGRQEYKNLLETVSKLGAHCRANGFDPTRTFQHVAQIDQSVWAVILEVFAKYDYETGELMDDGLLYRTEVKPNGESVLRLNRDFFYTLIGHLEASGYPCDMRSKIKLN